MSTDHPDLAAEQAHMDRATVALETTREHLREQLNRPLNGGGMRMAERALRNQTAERLERLPASGEPLFFGRLDTEDGDAWHVGVAGIHEGNSLLVVSFESKLGGKYADATPEDPQGIRRRRSFSVAQGPVVLSLRDEMLDGSEDGSAGVRDAILASLEAERSNEMRHIAATIERDQNRLIRYDRSGVLVVQGGPGTGKTAVALHRASWLAFTFASELGTSGGILVVGPNPTFMTYIESVLPRLGKTFVTQLPVQSVGRVRAQADEPRELAALKGDARMAQVLARAARSVISPPEEDTTIRFDLTDVVLPAAEVETLVRRAQAPGRPYMSARARFRRLAGELFRERYELARGNRTAGGSVQRFLNQTSGPWFNFLQRVWPTMAAEQLLHELYTVARRRRDATEGVLDTREAEALARPDVKRVGDHAWTAADAVLIDEADHVLNGTQGGFRYVIVDEAQDLSPMQLRMVGRRSSTGDLTLVGDLAQAAGVCPHTSWHEILGHVGSTKPATIETLSVGYRVPSEVLEYANALLPAIAPGLEPTTGIRSTEGAWILEVDEDVAWYAASTTTDLLAERGTIGVIAPATSLAAVAEALTDEEIAFATATSGLDHRVTLLASGDAKGLEFDHVVVVEPSAIVAEAAQGLPELYVALTRPTQSLTVVHALDLPAALR